jgi:UPF0755 protein
MSAARPVFRRLRRFILPLCGAALAVLAIVLFLHAELDLPTRRSRSGGGTIRVSPGSSLRAVTEDLARAGWIRNPRLLAEWGRRRRLDQRILPGRYKLERGWPPKKVIEEIGAGNVETARVTIPEGWREAQVLVLLADSLECGIDDLRAAADDSSWVRGLGIWRGRLEGYLFPETYLMPKEYDPRAALARMVRESDRRFDEPMRRRAARIGWDRESVVTLASIVQAEAAREAEMPRIASVFLNRLRKGWRLEADPTVMYALARFTGPPVRRDLDVESPYNTYRARGLPPGPICNPGVAAIRAVLWPDSGRQEFFFVAKGDGSHAFSRTLKEHNQTRRRLKSARGDR